MIVGLQFLFKEWQNMIRMLTQKEYIYVSGLIHELWCFYVSVPNSELHSKICQSRTISTVEIFRTAFLCRLPVRTGYKHIQAHMQGANVHTHTRLEIYNQLSHEHTRRNTDLFFHSHLSEFGFLLACQHKIWFVSAHKELTTDCTSFYDVLGIKVIFSPYR